MGTAINALELLNFFTIARSEIGLSQFTRLSKRNKATVLRHLRALEEFGLVQQDSQSKLYSIGPAANRLAALRESSHPQLKAARQIVKKAVDLVCESAQLCLLENEILQALAAVESPSYGLGVSLKPTEILPLNATASGLCILSFGPRSLLDSLNRGKLPKFTEATLTDSAVIRDRLAKIRESGWSFCCGTYQAGVIELAAPVFGHDQRALGAVAFAVPEMRASDDRIAPLVSALYTLSKELTAVFGGQSPENFPAEFQADSQIIPTQGANCHEGL